MERIVFLSFCCDCISLLINADYFVAMQIIQTDGFTCPEMLEGRPWSYQTDIFCVASTVHVMLFGEYMQVVKKFGQYDIKQKLPR